MGCWLPAQAASRGSQHSGLAGLAGLAGVGQAAASIASPLAAFLPAGAFMVGLRRGKEKWRECDGLAPGHYCRGSSVIPSEDEIIKPHPLISSAHLGHVLDSTVNERDIVCTDNTSAHEKQYFHHSIFKEINVETVLAFLFEI